jgi:signal transduction histidine kinase
MDIDRDATVAARPRWTVRLRLTALYGILFLASGALLLAITYGLVDRATHGAGVPVVMPGGGEVSSGSDEVSGPPGLGVVDVGPDGDIQDLDPELLRELNAQQHVERMHELLTQSGIALGVMVFVSVALGWVVAGRVLRPLRTIAASTRTITATNLHQRLDLAGPRDELTDLAETIDDLLARLEAAFEAQRRFVANASHELRTPLARQRTIAQVALDDPEATVESLRTAHERVLAAGAQQERLIEALLTLARGQAGLGDTEPVDLRALADRVVQARSEEMSKRSLRLQLDLQLAWVRGDPRLLERIVANLVDNAIRHNHIGGSIRIASGAPGHNRFLSVSNTGAVVPEDAVAELFQPFRRRDPHRGAHGDGIGLGLSIVKAIADVHGAAINTKPQSNGGLTVEVTFPGAEPAPALPPRSGTPPTHGALPPQRADRAAGTGHESRTRSA